MWIATIWAAFALTLPLAASAQVAFGDYRNADLIFHRSTTEQSRAIEVATGGRYTHVGIVWVTPDERVTVLEANRGVEETPVGEFIRRGNGRYSVYRMEALDEAAAALIVDSARILVGKLPCDRYFRLTRSAMYSSELPYHLFADAGYPLGVMQRLSQLNIDTPEARKLFGIRWASHPDCVRGKLGREECWALIREQELITPVGLLADGKLTLMYSNFR